MASYDVASYIWQALVGGMQMIFVGDFYQLPPVSKGRGVIDNMHSTVVKSKT
jgi:hypothetical protein